MRTVQVTELLIMQSFPFLYTPQTFTFYVQYSHKYPVLKHPKMTFLPLSDNVVQVKLGLSIFTFKWRY
jgi:hypothetical protein